MNCINISLYSGKNFSRAIPKDFYAFCEKAKRGEVQPTQNNVEIEITVKVNGVIHEFRNITSRYTSEIRDEILKTLSSEV